VKILEGKVNKISNSELFPKKAKENEDEEDFFCESFFIAGLLPDSKARIISDSENISSPCRHKFCSKLPAFKPEILFRIPEHDTYKLEINSLVRISYNN